MHCKSFPFGTRAATRAWKLLLVVGVVLLPAINAPRGGAMAFSSELIRLEKTPYQIHRVTVSGVLRPFLVLPPAEMQPGQKYPLVLFLHGAGERGDDLHRVVVHLPLQMLEPEYRRRYPCFFVVPQCPDDQMWIHQHWSAPHSEPLPNEPTEALQMAAAACDQVEKNFPVDLRRIYLTGLSMGGFGVWELAMRQPDRFAALVPICGGADERQANRLVHLPIWTAHGDADTVVPVDRTRAIVAALRQAGSAIRYNEYVGEGHGSWTPAYLLESGILDWMFQQQR